MPNDTLSVVGEGEFHVEVGSRPAGAALWGHLDMGGSRQEFALDTTAVPGYVDYLITPCVDCADFAHVSRGVHDTGPSPSFSSHAALDYQQTAPDYQSSDFGVRCARDE